MPEFEFAGGGGGGVKNRNPLKNKKLQPFLVGGIVLIVGYVLLKNIGGRNLTGTAYQGTYATNTGTTTEVSNMLEQYKSNTEQQLESQTDRVDAALEANNEQLLAYMEQLNSMFDAELAGFSSSYDADMEALTDTLKQMNDQHGELTTTVNQLISAGNMQLDKTTGALTDSKGNATSKGSQNLLDGGSSNYEASGGSSWIDKWKKDFAETPQIDKEGAQMFINNWAHHAHRNDSGTGSSFSDLSGHDTDYYYGGVTDSKVSTIKSQHSSNGFTGYDGSHVSAGITESIVTREDGSRVISYTPNADHWTRK